MVAEAVLLGPQNGILPGKVSMRHQIQTNSTISDDYLSVTLGMDVHVQTSPQVTQPTTLQESSGNDQNDLLVVVLFCSLMGIMAILPTLTSSED
jgi:hypothetical protein